MKERKRWMQDYSKETRFNTNVPVVFGVDYDEFIDVFDANSTLYCITILSFDTTALTLYTLVKD